jgi:LPXTG-motif cell wall-anchored protein
MDLPTGSKPAAQESAAMKNLGIVAIAVGIVILVLGMLGTLGSGTNMRGLLAAGVVILAAGFILYRRGRRRTSV